MNKKTQSKLDKHLKGTDLEKFYDLLPKYKNNLRYNEIDPSIATGEDGNGNMPVIVMQLDGGKFILSYVPDNLKSKVLDDQVDHSKPYIYIIFAESHLTGIERIFFMLSVYQQLLKVGDIEDMTIGKAECTEIEHIYRCENLIMQFLNPTDLEIYNELQKQIHAFRFEGLTRLPTFQQIQNTINNKTIMVN